MSAVVDHLLSEALLLPKESQTELVEALIERSELSQDYLDYQLGLIAQRRHNVQQGVSPLINAEEAHAKVLGAIKLRA